nr:retrovirus-related Pol polyprotein from transposon TNT 1-94 [Tanacetum cinerariifolium]
MELYMLNRKHGMMILEYVENGPLLWPTVKEDGVTRLKSYSELSAAEVIQADCDVKATNIILQGLPLEIYALVSTHKVAKELWERIQMLMQGTSLTKQERECKLYDAFDKFAYRKGETLLNQQSDFSQPDTGLVVPVFQKGDDPIDAINHMMSFLTAVVTSRPYTSGSSEKNSGKQRIVVCYNCKGEGHMSKQCTKLKRKRDEAWFKDKLLLDLFTSFDQYLIDEVSEVQKIFKQMEMAVEQHSAAKTEIQTKMENVLKENDCLLTHALGVDIVNIVVYDCMNVNCLTVNACEQCVTTESELKIDFLKKENYETADDKERKEESKVEDIKTQNLELDHRVTKLTAKNNHLKQTYKQLFDSIKSSRVQSKEQCDDLINKVNLKSIEVADLNASLQEKVLVITSLKEQLKGKAVLSKAVSLNPIDPALLQRNTLFSQESALTFAELFEINDLKAYAQAKDTVILKLREKLHSLTGDVNERKVKRELEEIKTLNIELDHKERVLVITALKESLSKLKGKAVVTEDVSLHPLDPELMKIDVTPLAPKLRVNLLSSASGSKTQDNTKNDRIQRTPRKAKKNKLEYHLRTVRPSLTKKSAVDTKATSSVTNFIENLGKLQPKADIEIFIGYAPTKKAFRIYNRRTRRIVETLHVDFDELTAMASEHRSLGPDLLFQPMFDELLNPPPSVDHQAAQLIAPIAEVIPQVQGDSTNSPSSTTVDQDAPSASKSHTTTEIQSSVIPQEVEEDNLDIKVAHIGNDPLHGKDCA